ncbi:MULTISPECIES: ArnT family glycosyltransferase [Prochlorococcus]|uniref:Dolichyl-phosphate-mannose-protein mannosyltransferase n=1 Tax=Prochlorococcus marinus str. MIT 9116 TaxID=167544 RepID=A0A0A1ZUJ9_PROMR|nr:glycosyltransferase family 39 protein [Prochlorococcus marinus]KGF91304.1 Dolichyl-phosphate-mannose-protein mannosyltransferase [Prochlorococcus marinus str. MIT 9107]KGF91833.1 Dolichyl-phosphate-mannose-protein mannosyltransferase [Prochlorococcus marinus str. MIT 9116]KGF93956.1 Dolichyl-phosphate-mannose-protein mannosyltransferase [Prochlorococcus marinus str. MIT 9123]
MINKISKFKHLLKLLIFIPLIFSLGKRSYIAFDEGFYALQARWILDKGNWTIPLWWDEYVLDRTIGIQFLIAKSQEILGKNMFSAYLPTTVAAILMILITYKLHEEFFSKKYAIVSPLILSTTYLWFDYSHLATQDIIFSCLVSIGIFSLVKIKSKDNKLYILLFGIWIGLAFMMKTFLVFVPLFSLLPYFFIKKKILSSKFFWLGLLVGFIPYILWSLSINPYLEKNIIFYLVEKFNSLSNKNTFTNPFYYYLWNIPATFLPWSFFAIIGTICNISQSKENKYILTYFPIIVIATLSIFSTKTPYYTLQISSIFSLNAYVGIKLLFNSKRYSQIIIFITSKIIPLFIFSLTFTYYFFFKDTINFNSTENTFLILGFVFFGLSWSFIKQKNSFKEILIILIIGPYLLTSFVLQSGLFTDRSRELREKMEYVSSLNIVKNKPINVDKSGITNSKSQSKIIRISLLTPKLGKGLESIDELNKSELAWSTGFKKIKNNNYAYEVIYENDILKPWKLVLKK